MDADSEEIKKYKVANLCIQYLIKELKMEINQLNQDTLKGAETLKTVRSKNYELLTELELVKADSEVELKEMSSAINRCNDLSDAYENEYVELTYEDYVIDSFIDSMISDKKLLKKKLSKKSSTTSLQHEEPCEHSEEFHKLREYIKKRESYLVLTQSKLFRTKLNLYSCREQCTTAISKTQCETRKNVKLQNALDAVLKENSALVVGLESNPDNARNPILAELVDQHHILEILIQIMQKRCFALRNEHCVCSTIFQQQQALFVETGHLFEDTMSKVFKAKKSLITALEEQIEGLAIQLDEAINRSGYLERQILSEKNDFVKSWDKYYSDELSRLDSRTQWSRETLSSVTEQNSMAMNELTKWRLRAERLKMKLLQENEDSLAEKGDAPTPKPSDEAKSFSGKPKEQNKAIEKVVFGEDDSDDEVASGYYKP